MTTYNERLMEVLNRKFDLLNNKEKNVNFQSEYNVIEKVESDLREKIEVVNQKLKELSNLFIKTKNEELIPYQNTGILTPLREENQGLVPEPPVPVPVPVKPTKKGKRYDLTWKTALAVATGIAIGATVYFTAGPMGILVTNLVAGIAKGVIGRERGKLKQQQLPGPMEVTSIQEPSKGIKGALSKFKNHLKSKEGLRDISWMLTSTMVTGSILSIGGKLFPRSGITQPISRPANSISSPVDSISSPVDSISSPVDSISNPTTHNISEVFDTAREAATGTGAENPLEWIDPKYGSHVSKIKDGAALVVNKFGEAQGWIPADGVQVGDIIDAATETLGRGR